MKIIYYFSFAALFVACTSKTNDQAERNTQGNTIENLVKIKDLNGNPIDLSQYEGNAIFINFWATWCAPCVEEMPSLERMQATFGEEQPIVFFYASHEPLPKIKKFVNQNPWNLNFAQLDMSLEELNIYALPTTIIFKDGEIAWTETGSKVWDSEKSIKEIKTFINR